LKLSPTVQQVNQSNCQFNKDLRNSCNKYAS